MPPTEHIVKHQTSANALAKRLWIAYIPLALAILCIDSDWPSRILLSLIALFVATLTFLLLTAITGFLPVAWVRHRAVTVVTICFGLLVGGAFFHSTNCFYGYRLSAFERATGVYPYWHITVQEYQYGWGQYLPNLQYRADSAYNRDLLQRAHFEPTTLAPIDSAYPHCYRKQRGHRDAWLCLDERYQQGRIGSMTSETE